jgi:hypothetical protein
MPRKANPYVFGVTGRKLRNAAAYAAGLAGEPVPAYCGREAWKCWVRGHYTWKGTIIVHSMNPPARMNMLRALRRHEQRRGKW